MFQLTLVNIKYYWTKYLVNIKHRIKYFRIQIFFFLVIVEQQLEFCRIKELKQKKSRNLQQFCK